MWQGASAMSVEWELCACNYGFSSGSWQHCFGCTADSEYSPQESQWRVNYNSAVLRQKYGQASVHLDGLEWDRVWRYFRDDRTRSLKVEGEKVTTWLSKVNWDCVLSRSIVARDKTEGTRFCKLRTTLWSNPCFPFRSVLGALRGWGGGGGCYELNIEKCNAISWWPDGWDHSRIIRGVNKLFWALRWTYLYWCLCRSLSCLMAVMHAGVGELLRLSSCEVENFCIWTPMELLLAMHNTGEPARRLITTQLAWKGSSPRHWGKTAPARLSH